MKTLPQIKTTSVKAKKSSLIFLGIIGAITITGELFCRTILGLGNPPLSITHPTIEYLFKPKQNVWRFGNKIFINQYGMRSNPISPKKTSPTENRVMVFGDSVVNGGNLTDRQKLATTIIQNKLDRLQDNPVFVGNISAGSWGPGNWLAYAKEYGFFEADTIILVISSHDYADNPTFQPLNPHTHPQQKPILALTEAVTRYLPRYLPKINIAKAKAKSQPNIQAENNEPSQDAIKQGLNDLKEFLLMAQKTGADVYVVQYWSQPEVNTGVVEKGHQEINQLVQSLNIPILQTYRAFKTAEQNGNSFFRDVIHPNDEGQKSLAKIILEILSN